MLSVVVCDDDKVTRGAVTSLCETAGLKVVAETDRWIAALELTRRFHVDVLVLDLMVADGSAERTLEGLRDDGVGPQVIVFTAFASDPARLLRLGAHEVIPKPDFLALGNVLEQLAKGSPPEGGRDDPRIDRRQGSADPQTVADLWRSPSGIAPARELERSLPHVAEGDEVLVVALHGLEAIETSIGRLLVQDCRLAVGRLLHMTVRIQDLVHEAPEDAGFVALLRGGDERSSHAVWNRLSGLVAASDVPGQLVGVRTRVDAMGGRDALARAIGALRSLERGRTGLVST